MKLARKSRVESVEDVLREAETALADPEFRTSRALVEDLLHPDFAEIGSSGEEYGREQMIELMMVEPPGEVIIRDFSATEVSEDVAVATYRTVGMSGQEVRRTSLWVRVDGQWQMRHHQGTRVPDNWNRSF
jgi:ribonuclease HI